MMSPDDPIEVKEGRPDTFGWLRRKDLEIPNGGQVWEMPDGGLYEFPPGVEAKLFKYKGLG